MKEETDTKKSKKRGYKSFTFFAEKEDYELIIAVCAEDNRSVWGEIVWLFRKRQEDLATERAMKRQSGGPHSGTVFLSGGTGPVSPDFQVMDGRHKRKNRPAK